MGKPYKNIITDKITSYSRYIILAEYDTRTDAENNLEKDVSEWKNKNKTLYKKLYPLAWATVRESL